MSTARHPPRRLGLGSAVALVVANMIGAGVFTTSGFALADLGRPAPVLAAWLIGGVLAMCGAVSYGALARRIPESGGEYTFLSATVHPLAGFLAGWVSLLAGFTGPIAAAALGLQAYAGAAFGGTFESAWVATFVILLATTLHAARLREAVAVQNAAVVTKMILIAGLVVLGLGTIDVGAPAATLSTDPVEVAAFGATLVWISFSYSGWNAAVYVAGEIRSPERNLQRALLLATGLVTVAYLGLNAVFLYAAPAADVAGRAEVAAIAAEALGGPALRQGVSALVALALFTSISSMVMAGPRVYARMAEDGLFPARFAFTGDVPTAAIALQGGLAIAVVWITNLGELLGYLGFTLSLSAAATIGGLMALRRREGAARVPVPGYPWTPLVFILTTLAAAAFMIQRRPGEALVGLATMASGVPLYLLVRRGRTRATDRARPGGRSRGRRA